MIPAEKLAEVRELAKDIFDPVRRKNAEGWIAWARTYLGEKYHLPDDIAAQQDSLINVKEANHLTIAAEHMLARATQAEAERDLVKAELATWKANYNIVGQLFDQAQDEVDALSTPAPATESTVKKEV